MGLTNKTAVWLVCVYVLWLKLDGGWVSMRFWNVCIEEKSIVLGHGYASM